MTDPELPAADDSSAVPVPPAADATAIQGDTSPQPPATAITDEAPVPIPPPQTAPRAPVLVPLRVGGLDILLVGLVLLLAFLLGSFAVQNPDLWMHLAGGRALAQGTYTFGVDPFSYTTQGVYWVNHSWLFDWLLYLLYDLTGATGLVIFRGLLCVALAGILLGIRRPGQSLWLPAVCTALALLALSIRVPLSPLLVSYVFLALTLSLLHRGVHLGTTFTLRGRSFSPLWLLPPLFALWVNLDTWFLLGPLAVALFLVALLARRLLGPPYPSPATVGLVLLAGLAACLLNPHLHRAFVLPLDLAYPLADVLPPALAPGGAAAHQAADLFPGLFTIFSPFTEGYWGFASSGRNVAGLTYFVLLALGAVSFGLRSRAPATSGDKDQGDGVPASRLVLLPPTGFPVGLFLVWLLFAGLSAFNYRFIPFYAVMAGPVCALNLQEFAVTTAWRNWLVGGRVATVLGCLLLLFLAWPGWLHARPDDVRSSHRASWQVQVDPLLERAAARLNELLATGKLHHGFNLSPELSSYWAWFAGPKAKTFFDQRFAPFPEAAAQFARVSKALRDDTIARFSNKRPSGGIRALAAVYKIFRAHDVNYMVLTGLHNDDRMNLLAAGLLAEPSQWPLLYVDGRTAIFGWRDPTRKGDPFAGLRLDFNRLAFGPVPPERRAPENAPVPPDEVPGFWSHYLFGEAPPPPSTSAARFYLTVYDLLARRWQRMQAVYRAAAQPVAWLSPLGAATVVPAPLSGPLAVCLTLARDLEQQQLAEAGVALEALPVLAVRAARRGVAENPADADAYFQLAHAFEVLSRNLENRLAPPRAPLATAPSLLTRQGLRHVQLVMALNHALTLRPDSMKLHASLAETFQNIGYLDAALEHLEEAQRALSTGRAHSGQEKVFEEQIGKRIEALVPVLSEEVRRRRDYYEVHSPQQRSVLGKFEVAVVRPTKVRGPNNQEIAVPRGLALLGLNLLREAKVDGLSEREKHNVASWQLRLMLTLGLSKLVREQFEGDMPGRLQPLLKGEYDADGVLLAAALGDYARALQTLADWVKEVPAKQLHADMERTAKGLEAERPMLFLSALPAAPPVAVLQPLPAPRVPLSLYVNQMLINKSRQNVEILRQTAELRALRGLLALDRGDTAAAAADLDGAIEIAGPRINFPSRALVDVYRRWLKMYRF